MGNETKDIVDQALNNQAVLKNKLVSVLEREFVSCYVVIDGHTPTEFSFGLDGELARDVVKVIKERL